MKVQGIVAAAAILLGANMANAVEITVLSTQATEQAYRELLPQFEKATGHTVKITYTGTLDAKKRIAAGEAFDVLIMASPDIDGFLADGTLFAERMIRDGYAVHYVYDRVPSIYAERLSAAQQAAQRAGSGLWSPLTCAGDPHAPSAAPH